MKTTILTLFLLISIFPQQIPFPQDTIAYDVLFNNRMFPVYDQQGKIHLTYTGQVGTNSNSSEIYYAKEENDGSFTTVNLTNNDVSDNYSTLSIDPGGSLHLGYTGRDAGGLFQIKYMNNINGWGQPVWITQGGLNKATPYSKVGPDSVVHFIFYTYVTGEDHAFYTFFDARDSIMQLTPTTLSVAEAGGDFEGSLDVDHNGAAHIVLKSGPSAFGGPLKYFNTTSGSIAEVPTGVSVNVTNPKVIIDKNNKVHILYRNESDLRLYMINNASGSFSSPLAVTPAGQRPAGAQKLAVDTLNRIYITYQSSVAASGKGFYFVYNDNGVVSDTMLIYDLTPEYVTRNSSAVIARNSGQMALFYAPGGVISGNTVCHIYMKKGHIDDTPVELSSFTASVNGNDVILNWSTASEKNNKGFEVQRFDNEWVTLHFAPGSGTTTEKSEYNFTDKQLKPGRYLYRLKQIDYDGTYEFSAETEAEVMNVSEYTLYQNYPNPFNPSTLIRFSIPGTASGRTTLKVYDVLGNETALLFNEDNASGYYEVEFNASQLSSGVYYYKLQSSNFTSVKKMIMVK